MVARIVFRVKGKCQKGNSSACNETIFRSHRDDAYNVCTKDDHMTNFQK